MRIAEVAPLFERVPPRMYGGTERVVSYLTEELVAQGHEVTLFASGDSLTSARLVSPIPEALRLARHPHDRLAAQMTLVRQLAGEIEQFDIVHNHADQLVFPLLRHAGASLTTPHGRLDRGPWPLLTARFADLPLSSISFAQRRPLPDVQWAGTVYHGIPRDRFAVRGAHGDYLVFIGRISPEKGVDAAIQIARASGMPLKIAAKVTEPDSPYAEYVMRAMSRDPLVEFLGEVDELAKTELLSNAHALLFPIAWPEPFGLVVIEAMACGTPVIAFRHGAVPEIVQDGVTGFVVDDVASAVTAVGRVVEIDRRRCREVFERRFTAHRMASDYVELFSELVEASRAVPRRATLRRPRVAAALPIPENVDGERPTASV